MSQQLATHKERGGEAMPATEVGNDSRKPAGMDDCALQLMPRDIQTVDLVFWLQAATMEQVQIGAGFPMPCRVTAKRRLAKLVRKRYLAMLPRFPNAPAIYVVNQNSPAGIQLLKEHWGEQTVRKQLRRRIESLPHTLAINDVRVRIMRGCADTGFTLKTWQTATDMYPLLKGEQLIPDGLFQIERVVNGETKTANFFLEVEKMSRDFRVLREKLAKYGKLAYTGKFTRLFGIKALRLLVIFVQEEGEPVQKRIRNSVAEASRLGVTIAHFTSLPAIKAVSPVDCLTAPLWQSPRADEPLSLFPAASDIFRQTG
jgi:hypothetical protein